jgi:hypothetical protein
VNNEKTAHAGRAFAAVIAATAMPYGYTVSLWCTGALLIHSRGNPSVAEIALFAAGAVAAFGALAAQARPRLPRKLRRPLDPGLVGALHWFAVGAAVGSAALIANIASWVDWPLASFAATGLYLIGASLEAALTTVPSGPDPGG